jgi:predicted ATPase
MPADGPLAAGDLTPGGLTGRDGDTAHVRRMLDNSQLVTVTGLPGVGKTAVALAAAVAAAGAYADGSLLLRLDGLSDEALLPHTIAAVLQLDDDFAASRLEVLVDQLRDRHMLIVLDTCEHLLGACAGLIAALLPRCPKVQFLATSREPLRVPGESVVTIRPLRLVDAMTLFSQRAAAAGLVTGPEHRATIASVCVQLDKLPLAIELASAGLAGLGEPPAAVLGGLLGRLERGEDVLGAAGAAPAQPVQGPPVQGPPVQGPPVQGPPVQGPPVQGPPVQARHGEPRQRSMRTAIGWSHELCTPAERLLWARLSVFGGPFTLRAAQDVCATSQLPDEAIEAGLALLTERSVLLALGPDGAGPRFALPVTLRVYGGQMLRRLGQEQEFEDRYRRWQQTPAK